ncbi:unnamed protein product [Rotaria sp. Silwood2]|nr:unnamed protein product [Rotaria sp. Silwood2]CAF4329657.1 unnamed protein product [Rotaria sp. Silwood2]CAF4439111.1 unnamed protein product [Rotaria sp. Silwood2]
MHEVEQEEIDRTKKEKRAPPPLRMIFDIDHRNHDRRLYNLPTANKVAAVFVGEDNEVPTHRQIAIHPRGKGLEIISILHPHCDPMIYPLLFPRGDEGCHRLTVRQTFNAIHYGGKLFQQYIVDVYVKTEQNCLAFHQQNQKTPIVELYQGLMNHLANEAVIEGLKSGQVVILP